MAYCVYEDLAERIVSGKVIRDKALEIANNPKYDEYQKELASFIYKLFDKRSSKEGKR